MKNRILVFAAVIGCCQSITAYALSATLKILPHQYLVNESAFESAAAAVSAVLEMKPTSIDIEACNGMATQRVIDVMETLMTQYPGRITLKTIHDDQAVCPGFSSLPATANDQTSEPRRKR